MTHQVVVSIFAKESRTITKSFLKFGSFLVDVNALAIPYNNLFIGASLREKEDKKERMHTSLRLDHMQSCMLK